MDEWRTFSHKKVVDLLRLRKVSQTNRLKGRWMDGRTDDQMDTLAYRDARTHLKRNKENIIGFSNVKKG